MSNTMYAITSYRQRNGLRPLREVAAEQAERLRAMHTPVARPVRSAVAERVAAVKADPAFTGRPTGAGSTAPDRTHRSVTSAGRRPTFAEVDALALSVPEGLYALPRREASSAGNTVTFFKVHKYRGGHRIVQLIGSVGAFAEQPLPVHHQAFALRHIAEDVRSASALFGRETATCGVCGSPLTNDASRARGIGPKCATKF